jgi:hypothetical protein
MEKRIAFVKTGWSEEYQGGLVVGRYAYEEDYHERFNFLQVPNKGFFGHVPPIGERYRPPQPKNNQDWLVIFVAARNGSGPLTVVGWYRYATFEREYQPRPEYSMGEGFPTDANGNRFVYCIHAPEGHLIQAPDREITIPGTRFRRPSIVYVRGTDHDDAWRKELATLAEQLIKTAKQGEAPPRLTFPDQAHRKKVEVAAIEAAIKYLEGMKYRVTDRQNDNCGYDLLAKRDQPPEEVHVEVKGTSSKTQRFFMSRNEKQYMSYPKWRLLIVTEALGTPQVTMMTKKEVNETFEFNAFAWEATLK